MTDKDNPTRTLQPEPAEGSREVVDRELTRREQQDTAEDRAKGKPAKSTGEH